MTNHTTEVLVGGVVLAAAIGFFVYVTQVTGGGPSGSAVATYSASFSSVEGVTVGTDVRLGGVKVGTVTDLSLNPQTFLAETSFSVDSKIRLPEDTAVLISSEGLLGGSFVEILPGGSQFELEPGAEIEDTQSYVSLINLLLRFVSGGGEAATE